MDDVTAEKIAAGLVCPLLTQALAMRNAGVAVRRDGSEQFFLDCQGPKCMAFNRLPCEVTRGFECLMMRKGE